MLAIIIIAAVMAFPFVLGLAMTAVQTFRRPLHVRRYHHNRNNRRPYVRRPLDVRIIPANSAAGRRVIRRAIRATTGTTFSLRATAAAWTAGELSGRAMDAGLLHMPSMNSAKVFLATFGLVLMCEAFHMGWTSPDEPEPEHYPEPKPAMIATANHRRPAGPPPLTNPLDDE